jgi:hypothetical protein
MLDDQLTLRRAIADLSYLTSAGAYAYGVVASISADAAITDTGANTGYKLLAEVLRNPVTPTGLLVLLPGVSLGGGMTTTGAPTAAKLTLTITFSDDGTNAAGESISVDVQSVTIASNAATLTTKNYVALPPHNHSYIKIAWATTFTAGTSPTAAWGPLGLYGAVGPNNLNGVDWTVRS